MTSFVVIHSRILVSISVELISQAITKVEDQNFSNFQTFIVHM